MANKINIKSKYPVFNKKQRRAHFENAISSDVNTDPERYELVEYFKKKPGINADMIIDPDADSASALVAYVIANKDFETAGTGGLTSLVTFSTTTSGILLTTASLASQQIIIRPHQDTNQTAWQVVPWGTENQIIWEAVIRTGTSVAAVVLMAGLRQSAAVDSGGDDDAAFFRFDTNVANWEATTSIAGTDVEFDTDIVVKINTTYYLRIEIDANRIPHFYIDDKEVYVGTALTDNEDLIPTVGIEGNAKTMYLMKEKISRIVYE